MSIVLFKTFEVILALSVLVFVHELGHFVFSKLFGIRVEKFFIFFDAGGRKLWSKKIGETEYGIGWLPLGGYCKIAGMVDESMDLEAMAREPQPWEFRTHPAWQRFFVMFGGVLFNFILAICLYTGICYGWGSAYVGNDGARIYTNSLSHEMGFRTGDHIISYDDYMIEDFGQLQADLAYRNVEKAVILRDDDTVNLYIDHAYMPLILKTPGMFDLAYEFVVDSVANAALVGSIARGDKLVGVNGERYEWAQDVRNAIMAHPSDSVELLVQRGAAGAAGAGCGAEAGAAAGAAGCGAEEFVVRGQTDSLGRLGLYIQLPENLVRTRSYTLLEAIPAGFETAFSTLGTYARSLGMMARPETEAYKSVGSFISIGRVFPSSWNWEIFLSMLAFLSIMLAVMNILPIPGLDGGHILFLLIEIFTGHKLSTRAMAVLQMIGMFLLVALMVLACGNDIASLF